MTDLNPKPEWSAVRQLEQTDRAIAGPGGVMNAQAQALLNRTEFLNNEKASNDQVMHIEKKVSDKANTEYVDQKVAAIENGQAGTYATVDEAMLFSSEWKANTSITITADGDKSGLYRWDGYNLVRSEYDPEFKAKKYTDSQLLEMTNRQQVRLLSNEKNLIDITDENGIRTWLSADSEGGIPKSSLNAIQGVQKFKSGEAEGIQFTDENGVAFSLGLNSDGGLSEATIREFQKFKSGEAEGIQFTDENGVAFSLGLNSDGNLSNETIREFQKFKSSESAGLHFTDENGVLFDLSLNDDGSFSDSTKESLETNAAGLSSH